VASARWSAGHPGALVEQLTRSCDSSVVDIETARLILKPWTEDYTDDFARLCGDERVMKYISRGRALTHDEANKISERATGLWVEHGYGPWVALDKVSGRFVGRIGLNLLADWPLLDKWEVGWELIPEFWGRGLASEGGKTAVDYGFAQAHLRRIISVTVAGNAASRRVMEKVGLTFQGFFAYRDATDVVWYAADNPREKP